MKTKETVLTNYMKFKDELIKLRLAGEWGVSKDTRKPCFCHELDDCADCLFEGLKPCNLSRKKWLDERYTEKTLKCCQDCSHYHKMSELFKDYDIDFNLEILDGVCDIDTSVVEPDRDVCDKAE